MTSHGSGVSFPNNVSEKRENACKENQTADLYRQCIQFSGLINFSVMVREAVPIYQNKL